MEFFLAESNWLFTAGLMIMLALGALELLALVLGASLSGYLDGMIPDVGDGGGLAWLHVGRVPFLALLILFLALFSGLGFIIQGAAASLTGSGLPVPLAAPLALLGALPGVRWTGGWLGRLLPRDESYALRAAGFIGRSVVIAAGQARRGRAAEAKFSDEYGQVHYVMVEPEHDDGILQAGEPLLLVRQIGEARYLAAPNPAGRYD